MNDALARTLWDMALSSRWFSGREGRLESVEVSPWAASGLRPAFLNVTFDDGHAERFFIPLSYRQGTDPVDATDDGRVLLDALRSEAPGFEKLRDIPEGLPAKRYTGEQSNTSVFYGTDLLAKVFRRIEPGENVDVELHRALAGTGVVAELYGVWSADGADLAVFLETLHDPTDGYVLACEYARDGRDFTDHARALGAALATVHRVLAERLPTATINGQDLLDECLQRFDAAMAEIPALNEYADAAKAAFSRIPASDLPAQRIHGDCHLGQVLLSEGRWRYVDFEGEPLKSLEERRKPDSPLRDVAGMLRSFGYAAAAGDAPDAWLHECRRAFLDGYGLADGEDDPVLAAYETDKAAYETQYESRYRPEMLRVPLSYLETLDAVER